MLRDTNRLGRHLGLILIGLAALLPAPVLASGLLWSISDGETLQGYLLGTVHSEDPRLTELSQATEAAFDQSATFAMELVPDLATLNRLNEAMYYQDDHRLGDAVGSDLYDRVVPLLAEYGVPETQAARLKPWAAAVMLSVPPPDTGLFMDFALAMRAAGEGKQVVGLETVDEQLAFLEGMPSSDQRAMLAVAVAEHDQLADAHHRIVALYLTGDLDALSEFADAEMSKISESAQTYFREAGLEQRNQRMLERLQALLGEERVFAAVGALHLPGDGGLVALLREAGYTLKPLQ